MYFPIADIDVNPLAPLIIGLAVSAVSSPTGISGGFLILPVSVNCLGFTSMAVSPTNFLFNILAMPSGIWRLHREKRLVWGLGIILMLGSLPGVFIGAVIRGTWLRDIQDFKIFVGLVLALLAANILRDLARPSQRTQKAERAFREKTGGGSFSGGLAVNYQGGRMNLHFGGQDFSVSISGLFFLSLAVGLVGGIYGIGGAAIIAPMLVGYFKLPVYVAGGASLLAGWAGAIFGLLAYAFFWPLVSGQPPVRPDWALGILFGLGGMVGVYAGARLQRFLPPTPLKLLMFGLVAAMAAGNLGLF